MSKLLKAHQPCPTCGSSDALSYYTDGTWCYSCETLTKDENMEIPQDKPKIVKNDALSKGKTQELIKRKITKETCLKYNVTVEDGKHIYPYYDINNSHVGNKIRLVANKGFSAEGNLPRAVMFGQNKFPQGGKYLTICEGEIDA